MKVEILSENLNSALSAICRSVSSRVQLPILSNVLLIAEKEGVKLIATDLEMSVRMLVGAKVLEEGRICVPAKTFAEIVATLPKGVVELTSTDDNVKVVAGKTKCQLQAMVADEFPSVPEFSGEPDIVISAKDLLDNISQVLISASKDDTRPVLTGLSWRKVDGGVRLAATDGFRLSVSQLQLPITTELNCIIPARTLLELIRLIGKDTSVSVEVKVEIDKQQVLFRVGNTELVSRLLAGDFPAFDQILPKAYSSKITVDRLELLEALKRATIFARDTANTVKLKVEGERLVISSNSAQLGQSESELEISIEGEPVEVAFNSRYLIEYLNTIDGDSVVWETEGGLKPGVFKLPQATFVHVIMPMRVS